MRVLVLLCSFLFSAAFGAAERTIHRSLQVDDNVRVTIDLHRGDVEVLTGASDTVDVTLGIRHRDEEVRDAVALVVEGSPSTVDISVDYEAGDSRPFWRLGWGREREYPDLHVTIMVPNGASLDLRGHRADFDVEAPAGRIDISSHRGSGRVSGVRERLRIDTHRGDFSVDVATLADIDLDTHRGNIDLAVTDAEDFMLVGETHRGEFRATGKNISVERRDRGSRVDHREGSGDNHIRFNTHRGNISIDFRE